MFEQLISIETFGGLVGLIVAVLALYELLIILPLRLRLRRCAAALAALEQRTAGLPALERKHNALARDVDGRLRQLGERIGQIELRSESRPYERAIDAAARGGPA
ncbi:MAG: hypothetical protein R3305_08525, partial [Gammaproteobacteria bacterium]|nr:hypothetical protein [Gammaproteobacteria bacterium]